MKDILGQFQNEAIQLGPTKAKVIPVSFIVIDQLERRVLFLDYPLAGGLSGGFCKLCRKCVGPAAPCRHPLMARPSIEGMGIDVIQTAKKIGLAFDFSSQKRLFWNGLLLIDHIKALY